MHTPDKHKALEGALSTLDKQFGAGTVMRLGEQAQQSVATVSTGSLAIDRALGIGGLPRGRVIEVYGPESSGKTTLTLQLIAEVQRAGGIAAFVDAEHALDVSYAKKLGVDVDQLLVSQPDSGEQALEITETLVRSGAIDLLVVDSVAALTPQAEIEGQMGDSHVGLQARLMSQALRKLTGITSRTGTMVVFINQVRQKIGVTWGNGEVTTGGNALKFYSSVRLEIRRIGAVKEGTEHIGNKVRVRVVKNKLAPPFKTVEVEIIYGRGICPAGDLLDLAEETGRVQRAGAWYSMGDERLGQGREKARARLLEEEELFMALLDEVRSDLFGGPIPEAK
ncbi:MAG: recombinase RecA [Deltaproteobacteria bacterium]|nr:MAG: recombinase RecA [Deltaproteobacteria bacterium]